MRQVIWTLVLLIVAALAYSLWRGVRRYRERRNAEAARMARFLAHAGALAAANPGRNSLPAPGNPAGGTAALPDAAAGGAEAQALAQQRLLFEAATKAGEAGEPALAIQLYARLIVRYPQSTLADKARAAVQTQKKRLAKP